MSCNIPSKPLENNNANGTRKPLKVIDVMEQAYRRLRIGDGASSCINPEDIGAIKDALIRIFDRFSTEGAFLPLVYTFDFPIEISKREYCIGPSGDFVTHGVPQSIWWAEWHLRHKQVIHKDCDACDLDHDGHRQIREIVHECGSIPIEVRRLENFSRLEFGGHGHFQSFRPNLMWYQSSSPNAEIVFNCAPCRGDILRIKPLLPFDVDLFDSACKTICKVDENEPDQFEWMIEEVCLVADPVAIIEQAQKDFKRSKCKGDCFTTQVEICDPCKGKQCVTVTAKRKCRSKPNTYTMQKPIELPTGYHDALVAILTAEIAIEFREKTDPRIVQAARRAETRLMRRNSRQQEEYPDKTTPWGYRTLNSCYGRLGW